MSDTSSLRLWKPFARLPLFWRLQFAGWFAFSVLALPLKAVVFGSFREAVVFTAAREPIGLLLTVGLRWVYRRLGLAGSRPLRLGVWVVVISMAAGGVDFGAGHAMNLAFGVPEPASTVAFGQFLLRCLLFVTWSFLYFWIRALIAEQQRALNLARAEATAKEAELQMLRAQVDPHFLFNALNTLLAGLSRDPKAMIPVVQGLADYLRYSLANRHAALVPLGEEFDAAMNYLVVEKARFREELLVETQVDEAARALPVPGVILQPLIENAVKHGYKSSPSPLRIRIRLEALADGGSTLEIANSGKWIEPPTQRASDDAGGAGLECLRRRLQLLYGARHRFDILKNANEVIIQIQLPAKSAITSTP